MTNLANSVLIIDAAISVALIFVTYFPVKKPIVLRLFAALDRARDRRYERNWLRLRAWEIQHPLDSRRDKP
jgi:hypothetical protein